MPRLVEIAILSLRRTSAVTGPSFMENAHLFFRLGSEISKTSFDPIRRSESIPQAMADRGGTVRCETIRPSEAALTEK